MLGTLTMNNLKMKDLVKNWMVLECITPNLSHTHAAFFYDNTSAVRWTIKIRSGFSLEAGLLLHFLVMRIHATQVSYLTLISISV